MNALSTPPRSSERPSVRSMVIMERTVGVSALDPDLPDQEGRSGAHKSVPPWAELDQVRVEVSLGAVVANARSVQALLGSSTGVLAVL